MLALMGMAGFWGGLAKVGLQLAPMAATAIGGPAGVAIRVGAPLAWRLMSERDQSFADNWVTVARKLLDDDSLSDDEREARLERKVRDDLEQMGKSPKRFRVRALASQAFMAAFGDFELDDDFDHDDPKGDN